MIGLAISILWLAIGIIFLLLCVWLAIYAVKLFAPVPPRVEQVIWVVVLILCLIGVLSMISGAGPSVGNVGIHFNR